jgi:serine/threonine-protein kinase HipA
LTDKGWSLSPVFDINPSIEKSGLSLCIDMEDNSLDLDLAKSVGAFFQLGPRQMNEIISEVQKAVRKWSAGANQIGIPPSQQELMRPAFIV